MDEHCSRFLGNRPLGNRPLGGLGTSNKKSSHDGKHLLGWPELAPKIGLGSQFSLRPPLQLALAHRC